MVHVPAHVREVNIHREQYCSSPQEEETMGFFVVSHAGLSHEKFPTSISRRGEYDRIPVYADTGLITDMHIMFQKLK
jgi:hypothetical protein